MQIATFSQSRNDMYWSIQTPDDCKITWTGYDDAFWWDRVSLSDAAMTRKGPKTGKIYTIQFDTAVVTVSDPVQA